MLYGLILIQPTAPMPVFGVLYEQAHGHVTTTILLALVAMLLTSVSYSRMARLYPAGGEEDSFLELVRRTIQDKLTGQPSLD